MGGFPNTTALFIRILGNPIHFQVFKGATGDTSNYLYRDMKASKVSEFRNLISEGPCKNRYISKFWSLYRPLFMDPAPLCALPACFIRLVKGHMVL